MDGERDQKNKKVMEMKARDVLMRKKEIGGIPLQKNSYIIVAVYKKSSAYPANKRREYPEDRIPSTLRSRHAFETKHGS